MTRSYEPAKVIATFTCGDPDACGPLRSLGVFAPGATIVIDIAHNEHYWRPIEGERARYHCACGEQMRRDERSGQLVAVPMDRRVQLDPRVQTTAPHGPIGANGCTWVGREDPEDF